MALQNIDDQGNIQWDCHNPDCKHHHCAGRDEYMVCPHHDEKAAGEPHRAHISHPEIQYTGPGIVALPACPDCLERSGGTNVSRMFLNVGLSEKELTPPVIERDAHGHILSVTVNGAPNFTVVKDHVETRLVELDSHTKAPEGAQLTTKDGKLYQVVKDYIIDDAYMAPWVQRHLDLHNQLQAIGKRHVPESSTEVVSPAEQSVALEQQALSLEDALRQLG